MTTQEQKIATVQHPLRSKDVLLPEVAFSSSCNEQHHQDPKGACHCPQDASCPVFGVAELLTHQRLFAHMKNFEIAMFVHRFRSCPPIQDLFLDELGRRSSATAGRLHAALVAKYWLAHG